jgi:hypothetical protein
MLTEKKELKEGRKEIVNTVQGIRKREIERNGDEGLLHQIVLLHFQRSESA